MCKIREYHRLKLKDCDTVVAIGQQQRMWMMVNFRMDVAQTWPKLIKMTVPILKEKRDNDYKEMKRGRIVVLQKGKTLKKKLGSCVSS